MEREYAEQKCRLCEKTIEKGSGIILAMWGDTPSPFPGMSGVHGALDPSAGSRIRFTPREDWFHHACYLKLLSAASAEGA